LTHRLRVAWNQPENGIAEIADIDADVLAEFSQRTRDLERRLEEKLDRFRQGLGRDPTGRERWRLEREAAVDSRPSKHHGATLADLCREWWERTVVLGRDPRLVVGRAVDQRRRLDGIDDQRGEGLTEAAIAALGDRQSSWRPAELVRELAAAVPTTVAADAAELTAALDRLADQVADNRCVDISRPVPAGARLRRDGRPITESAVDRALTTRAILDEEEKLIGWAEERKDPAAVSAKARSIRFAEHLTPGQAAAVAAVADGDGLELIVGPAGAGKTTALASAVLNVAARGRMAFGVAPTAAAAEVLATETGMRADTLDKLLTEHRHPTRPPGPIYNLAKGTTVIVDEAGTAATPNLAELARLADQHQWRVVLVGDPRQFSAVGRGSMFAHLVDTLGAVELDRIHRFNHHWERRASLNLRNGDPAALTHYQQHGRLHGGTIGQMESEIIEAWREARSQDRTVALMANSTETVTRLNQLAQHTRLAAQELHPEAPRLRVGEYSMLVGDEVVTRRNDRTLRTDQGLMVKNRDHWTITNIHGDRSVTATGRTGTIRLPAEYITEHLELGYAQTSHATQGRTVDTALLLVDAPTDGRGIYTPMTRGREANHAYVAVEGNRAAIDVLTQAVARDWTDQPAVARRNQLNQPRQLVL
ncbi:MAG: AAA family ATPase, partial [Acidimicrobiia bacterium]